jgi:hypothetical protein
VAKRTGNRTAPTKPQAPAVPKVSAAQDGGVAGANRRERKDEARRQREALMRKIQRRKQIRVWGLAAVAAAVVVVLVLMFVLRGGGTTTANGPKPIDWSKLPGLITSTDAGAWNANTADLSGRVRVLGLPPLTASEILAFHIHQEVQIFVDGAKVTIPKGIGIDEANQQIAVIHTHETDGVVHVESPKVSHVYTLGDFFGVWGLKLTKTCIGGLCTSGDKALRVYLNGTQVTGDPALVRLVNHQVFVVTYGTQQQLPNPIPSTFDFVNSTAGG